MWESSEAARKQSSDEQQQHWEAEEEAQKRLFVSITHMHTQATSNLCGFGV